MPPDENAAVEALSFHSAICYKLDKVHGSAAPEIIIDKTKALPPNL